jgi:WD40 repeat protein
MLLGAQGVYAWDIASGKLLRTIEPKMEDTFPPIILPGKRPLLLPASDGLYLAENSSDCYRKTGLLWAATTNILLQRVPTGAGATFYFAYTPDLRYLAMIEGFRTYSGKVCDLQTGTVVSKLADMSGAPVVMAISADGTTLAGSTFDKGILVWNAADGTLKKSIDATRPDGEPIRKMAISADGHMVAAAFPGEVRLYNVDSGKEAGVLKAGDALVSAVAFSPDGKLIAGGDEVGWARVWNLADRKLVFSAIGFSGPPGSRATSDWLICMPDGSYKWSPGAAQLIRWRIDGKLYPASKFGARMRSSER